MDVKAMQEAALRLHGRHDFSAFRSTSVDKANPICLIEDVEMLKLDESELQFEIQADHFLYNMVRIIVGTLVDIGLGKRQGQCLVDALESGNRDFLGPTAPPWGLCLEAVNYPASFELFGENTRPATNVPDSQPIERPSQNCSS
jgi:tRNA pseudouridine38-40 synthase